MSCIIDRLGDDGRDWLRADFKPTLQICYFLLQDAAAAAAAAASATADKSNAGPNQVTFDDFQPE